MALPAAIDPEVAVGNEAQKDHLRGLVAACAQFAPRDRAFHIAQIENGETTEDKINFYIQAAKLREQVLQNVPPHKRPAILNKINSVLDEHTGEGRGIKLQRLEEIGQAIELFRSDQTLLRHKMWRSQHLPSELGNQVLKTLISDDLERFNREYEQVFTPKFWGKIYGVFSRDFPEFVKSFPYPEEADFLEAFTSLEELPKFLVKLKTAAEKDTKKMLKSFFNKKAAAGYLEKLQIISSKDPEKIVHFLHELCEEREKNRREAQSILAWAEKLALAGELEAARSEVEIVQKRFGDVAIKGGGGIIEHLSWDLEKKAKKAKLEEKKAKLKDQRKERLMIGIDSALKRENFDGARILARQLQDLDHEEGEKAFQRIEDTEESQEQVVIQEGEESKENMSEGRRESIKFYEGTMEMLKGVMEEAEKMHIGANDEKWWCDLNRQKLLRDRGLYEKYRDLNNGDPFMPSTKQAGGFRFRWFDFKAGNRLNFENAKSGNIYLGRLKQSGYGLVVLAGVFSMNWQNPKDPIFTPQKMLEIVKRKLSELKGEVV